MKRAVAGGVLALLSIVMLLLVYGEVFGPLQATSFGIALASHGNKVIVAAVRPKSAASKAGVRPGDTVDVMAMPLANRLRLEVDGSPTGTVVRVPIERNGTRKTVTLVAEPYKNRGWSFSPWPLLAGATITLLIFALIVVRRPSIATAALVLYGMGACTTYGVTAEFTWLNDAAFGPVAFFILTAFTTLPIIALLPFIVRFPEPPVTRQGRLRMRLADGIFFVGAVLCALQILYEPRMFASWPVLDIWSNTAFMAIVLVFTASVYRDARGEARRRIGWVIAGMAVSAIGYALFNVVDVVLVAGTASQTLAIVAGASQLLQPALPIALAYAVLRHRVLDVGFALNRTMVYGVMTALVVVVVSLVDWLTSRMLSEQRWALAIEAVITIGFGFALNWIHAKTERLIDRIVFRARHLAEKRIEYRIAALGFATSAAAVDEALGVEGPRILGLHSGAVFTRSTTGEPFSRRAAIEWHDAALASVGDDDLLVRTLRSLERPIVLDDVAITLPGGPPQRARAVVAIPIIAQHDLMGFALYGNSRDGALPDPEEISLLQRLCAAGAGAYGAVDARQWRERLTVLERTISAVAH